MNHKMDLRVLVTGATSDIGRAVSVGLSKAGCSVIALGRDESALSELQASCGVAPLAIDVTDRDALASALESETLDVLVTMRESFPRSFPFTKWNRRISMRPWRSI